MRDELRDEEQARDVRLRRILLTQTANRMMCGPDGKLTRDAMLLLHYFRVFCRAHPGAPLAPVSPDGRIDPMLLARNAGRREVYDELFRILAASPIAAYQVENPLL